MKFLFILILVLAGCTDTDIARVKAIGKIGKISCYSGGQVIFEGTSTGRIQTVENSDGWEFKDTETGHFIRVSGDCVIRN